MQAEAQTLSRRDRVRAATSQEIIQVARRLLVTEGRSAMSLRAIAREMGMTAPALYRYYPSLEDLARHVVADIFTELVTAIEADVAEAGAAAELTTAAPAGKGSSGAGPAGPPVDRAGVTASELIAACRAFRSWAIGHPAEFGLIFGSPLPGVSAHDDPVSECGHAFGGIFLRLITRLWRTTSFDAPADDQLDPRLAPQLARYRDLLGSDLPLGVLQVFLRCWVLLYGTVSLEVFGHIKFALDDAEAMFELMLGDLASMIGLNYPVPA